MDSFKYSAFCIVAVILIIFMKEYDGRFALLLRMAFSVSAAIACALMFGKVYEYIGSVESVLGLNDEGGEIFRVMLKTTGISFIGCICASICRDSGENGIAGTVETICKLEIILLCIPVINLIFEKIGEVLA